MKRERQRDRETERERERERERGRRREREIERVKIRTWGITIKDPKGRVCVYTYYNTGSKKVLGTQVYNYETKKF